MSNELKDIVETLSYYGSSKGWEVIEAEKVGPGLWNLKIKKCQEEKEATNENN